MSAISKSLLKIWNRCRDIFHNLLMLNLNKFPFVFRQCARKIDAKSTLLFGECMRLAISQSFFSLFHYFYIECKMVGEWKGIFNITERVRGWEGEWEEMKKCRFFIHEGKNIAKEERWNELIMRSFFIAKKKTSKSVKCWWLMSRFSLVLKMKNFLIYLNSQLAIKKGFMILIYAFNIHDFISAFLYTPLNSFFLISFS